MRPGDDTAAALRARLNEELGFYPASLDPESIAEYRRSQAVATPPRRLRNTVITTFGPDLATADTEFVPDGSDTVGRQSQTWIRTAAGWRVVNGSMLVGRKVTDLDGRTGPFALFKRAASQ